MRGCGRQFGGQRVQHAPVDEHGIARLARELLKAQRDAGDTLAAIEEALAFAVVVAGPQGTEVCMPAQRALELLR